MSETRTRARALLANVMCGPWRVATITEDGNPEPKQILVIDADRDQIASVEVRSDAELFAAAPTLIATLCDEADAASAERAALRAVVCIDCGGTGGKRPNVGSTILYPPGTHCDKCGGSGAVIVKGDT